MSGKMLLPRHADKSKLRTKQLRFNIKYILILKFIFLLHNQINAIGANTYYSGFYKNSGFSEKSIIVKICVEIMQNLGG